MNSRRLGRVVAAAAGLGLVLGGCASEPGSAAIVADDVLSERDLATAMQEINEVLDRPTKAASAELTRNVLSQWMLHELVSRAADGLDISVTAAKVRSHRALTRLRIVLEEQDQALLPAFLQNALLLAGGFQRLEQITTGFLPSTYDHVINLEQLFPMIRGNEKPARFDA